MPNYLDIHILFIPDEYPESCQREAEELLLLGKDFQKKFRMLKERLDLKVSQIQFFCEHPDEALEVVNLEHTDLRICRCRICKKEI